MAILPVLHVPDPFLRKIARPVAAVDDEIRQLLEDMLETMRSFDGIGLAAPQVGRGLRALVMDVGAEAGGEFRMVNPRIVSRSEELAQYNEGCLSVPEEYAEVARPARVEVQYQDADGEAKSLSAEGLLATCVQHEIDHLDGKVFLDYLSPMRRDMILRRLKKRKLLADAP